MAITPLPLYKVPKLLWVSKGRSPRGWGRTQVDAVGERGGQAGGQHVLHHAEALAAEIFLLLLLLVVLGVRPHHIVQLRAPPRSSLGVPPQVGSPPPASCAPSSPAPRRPAPRPPPIWPHPGSGWGLPPSLRLWGGPGVSGGCHVCPAPQNPALDPGTPKPCAACALHPQTLHLHALHPHIQHPYAGTP